MVAGCYGLPQFRMRCFLFGACSDEVLPPFPLPTHSVIVRGGIPNQWERCLVAYDDKKQAPEWLQKPLVLKDAFSDLPAVRPSLSLPWWIISTIRMRCIMRRTHTHLSSGL